MSRTPRSTREILDVALDLNTGEIIIAGMRFKPSGAGCESPDVALDDGNAAFDLLRALRDECFDWRIYADALETWKHREPCMPHHGKPR